MKYCHECSYLRQQYVGDSFDRAKEWICKREEKVIDAYRDEKDGNPDIPEWCTLIDTIRMSKLKEFSDKDLKIELKRRKKSWKVLSSPFFFSKMRWM